MRYRLDPDVKVLDCGRSLLGGSPTRLLRLSDAGAAVVARWPQGGVEVAAGTTGGVRRLVDRLIDAGALHPVAEPGSVLPVEVDVVVPVRDRVEALDRCLAALRASGVGRIVVVDDGSTEGTAHALVARRHDARVVRCDRPAGPASARMAGVALTRAPFLAFIDSDVEVEPDWLTSLLGLFEDDHVGLVAPRVRHAGGPGLVDRYEVVSSPLDLGARTAPIAAGTPVSYVPAAALVIRRDAFDKVGGFDETLSVGEDVDLLWRLAGADWRCRYEPSSVVMHRGRSTLADVLARRFDYGLSAAPLQQRHPGALPPVRGSRWSAGVVGAVASGHPWVGTGVGVWTAGRLARKLGPLPDAHRVATRLVMAGHLGFARQFARALVRPWLPVTLLAALASRRFRRLALLAALAGPLDTWLRRRPEVPLPQWVALSLADDIAYTAGVWAGCIEQGDFGVLEPNCQN